MYNTDDIPEVSGVYLMKNNKNVIYVGKAKNLKKRVSSYFKKDHYFDKKTYELVKNIEDVDYIITNSELDALILENNLIKKYKPKYNIALKDEKTYPYIKITKEEFSRIEIIRSTKKMDYKNGDFFGPYPMGIYNFLKIIKKIYPIRDCSRNMTKVYERPCLKYFMKSCMGPCVYKDIRKEYQGFVRDLKQFLNGNIKKIVEEYQQEMEKASNEMEFEKAIEYREKVNEIEKVVKTQISETIGSESEDIFCFEVDGDELFIFVLSVRSGKIIAHNEIRLDISKCHFENIFETIFLKYYIKYPIPKMIVLEASYKSNENLIKEWFEVDKKKKVKLFFPKIKSRKKELLEMAKKNLKESKERYYLKKSILDKGILYLKERLDLKSLPKRIECFDISNIQGKDAVASMSVAINGRAARSEYRRYKIVSKDTPDDFAMMREVLNRRYSKLKIEELPDLILIDGGKGQLSSATEILKGLGKLENLDLISIAKKEELIFKSGELEPYLISKNNESIKILQRLRDESHRFGITYHRKLRSKRVLKSELDDVKGLGKKRKKLLLDKFRSVDKIKNASLVELIKLVPESVAIRIKALGGD